VLSVNLRLAADTRGLLDRRRLQSMKPGAVLANTARG
jgi:lactate dehydrogenase-like 2-hydroxyacid dehydrogenase